MFTVTVNGYEPLVNGKYSGPRGMFSLGSVCLLLLVLEQHSLHEIYFDNQYTFPAPSCDELASRTFSHCLKLPHLSHDASVS